MPQKEPDGDGPSLELPSFGLGRKRKQKKQREQPPEPAAEDAPAPPPAPEPEPGLQTAPVADTDLEPEPESTPVAEPEPEPTPVAEPEPEPAPAPVAEPAAPPEPEPDPVPEPAAAAPLFTEEAPTEPADPAQPQPATAPVATTETAERAPDEAPSRGRRVSFPTLPGPTAAVVTGAVIGLLTVGATWASLRLCELVQGTSSCGNPGFFLLLAIAILMVLLGQQLLTALGVSDAGSTSFLGVGLVGVVTLLFLVQLLFSWWMVLVVPLVAMGAFALSHWVTVTFVDIDPGDSMHR